MFLDADMEDYGFEYSEEEAEEQDVDIENQYYNSKGTLPFTIFVLAGCAKYLLVHDIYYSMLVWTYLAFFCFCQIYRVTANLIV